MSATGLDDMILFLKCVFLEKENKKPKQKTQTKTKIPVNSNPAKSVLWFFSLPGGLIPSKILSQLASTTSALPGRWEEHKVEWWMRRPVAKISYL